MKRGKDVLQRGMTLLELTVVLLILTALAGLVVPYVGGTGHTAMCQATDATMQTVKEAIMGGKGGAGYYGDLLGQLPRDRNIPNGWTLHYLFVRDDDADTNSTLNSTDGGKTNVDPFDEWPAYNAKTGVGWRGPYLQNGGKLDSEAAEKLHSSFNAHDATTDPGMANVDHRSTDLDVVFDAWHRPIILQVPYYDDGAGPQYHPEYARLVSAGPGNGIESGDAAIDTLINDPSANNRNTGTYANDDRVLFLRIPDPAIGGNRPCDQS